MQNAHSKTKDDIVMKAKELIDAHGEKLEVEGTSFYSHLYETDDFTIIYSTPEHGPEVLPGKRCYHVQIRYQGKIVFTEYFDWLGEPSLKAHKKRGAWVERFIALS